LQHDGDGNGKQAFIEHLIVKEGGRFHGYNIPKKGRSGNAEGRGKNHKKSFELYGAAKIKPDTTLLIFDEIQEVPRALSSLKYFSENAPEYHIICAGPLLGIALHSMLWNSIPRQLARENRKFMYGLIREGARAKEYEPALLWLADRGLVHQVRRVSVPRLPLKAYEDPRAFKLFALDLGLLGAMGKLPPELLLDGHALFREFKGALTEQYVLQELKTLNPPGPWYWSSGRGLAELDFVLQGPGGEPVPLEVKAELNLQAKSLKSYGEKFHPPLSLRASLADYKQHGAAPRQGRLVDIPLYGIGMLDIEYMRGLC
jgi:hypothetical protein